MIAPRTSVGERPHYVLLQNPGPAVPDGAGGFTQTWSDLAAPASVFAKIEPATAENLERVAAGVTVEANATHIISMPFHPSVTTKTRVVHNGRTFTVSGVSSPDERQQETIAIANEVVA